MQVGGTIGLKQCARWAICAMAFILNSVSGAVASGDPAAACDRAASRIAKETTVPLDVLRAITRTETGRSSGRELRPWPWTVNMEGQSVWFDTEAQAQLYVLRHFRAGARSFDVGCFQINYKWHGHAFTSIEQMFDPMINARYAARYLTQLFGAHGDWNKAVGAYHSKTQKYAQRYLSRYEDIRDNLPEDAPAEILRPTTLPLIPGQSVQHVTGSLMPIADNTKRRFIDNGQGS